MTMQHSGTRTAVDLFCGCGGISCGLGMAGFKVLAGVDVEPKYMATFSHNFPSAKSLGMDLSATSPQAFMDCVGIEPGSLDMLAGGPPCQGFSKNVPRKLRCIDSPNNVLIKTFLDYCEALQPAMVLMENVAEMKNGFQQAYSAEVERRLQDAGYAVSHGVLNAADYGVPQRRRRAFFLANRLGAEFQLPAATHALPKKLPSLFALPAHVTVWEAIGDLPALGNGEGEEYTEYGSHPFSGYQQAMRGGLRAVRNHVARPLRAKQHARLASIKPGQGVKDLPEHLQVKAGYSGAYGRLTKDMVAPTITRWVFHPGSGRWGHPVDIRVLTIREAARIQGFPDSFEFEGSYTQQAGQLGNAAPPLLIQRLAEMMVAQLDASCLASISRKDCTESLSA